MVAYGAPESIARRLNEHLEAGADHVAIQVLGGSDEIAAHAGRAGRAAGADSAGYRAGAVRVGTMRLLVTGGAGFIGANFVHSTVRERPDVAVTVLDALTYAGSRESLRRSRIAIRLVEGDITDAGLVDRLVAESDAVVHFAAETHVDNALADPRPFVHTNVVGTFTVLEAVRRHGVRLHHVSTDEVYGDLPLDDPEAIHRVDALQPVEPLLGDQGRAPTCWCGHGCGPTACGDDLQLLQQLRPLSARGEVHPPPDHQRPDGPRPKLYGAGANVRDWIHVDDHNSAVWRILEEGRVGAHLSDRRRRRARQPFGAAH